MSDLSISQLTAQTTMANTDLIAVAISGGNRKITYANFASPFAELAGTNTFANPVTVATPTAPGHATTKEYVDVGQFNADGLFSNLLVVPSVTAGNLTVTLNVLNGTIGASNPFFGYIGNTLISSTTTMTLTASAGTNWLNLGNAHFRDPSNNPYNVDIFVYLCFNTVSNLSQIIMSRIPYASSFGDFVNSQTDNYGRILTGSAPAAADLVRVVGRFSIRMNAALSFIAPPSFLTVVGRITESNFSFWTPVVTGEFTATFDGSGGRSGNYKIIGNMLSYTINAFGNVGVANTASLAATMPFATSAGDFGGGASVSSGAGNRAGVFDLTGASATTTVRDPITAFNTGFRGFRMSNFYRLLK